MVQVFPVHYDAATETTLFYPNVSIQVQTGTSPDTSQDGVHPLSTDTQEVEGMVVNPSMVTAYADQPLALSAQPLSLPSAGPYSYVIITSSALAASFQPLINQKIADGLTATIVTTDYIYANYTGTESHANDIMGAAGLEADQIRQFIANAYANWGTRWVLLGGDSTVIPMRTVYADADGRAIDDTLPTDDVLCLPERAVGQQRRPLLGRGGRWRGRRGHRPHARGLCGPGPGGKREPDGQLRGQDHPE